LRNSVIDREIEIFGPRVGARLCAEIFSISLGILNHEWNFEKIYIILQKSETLKILSKGK